MSFIPNIEIGEVVTREKIYSEFSCQQQKGIAHSKLNNALVLISDWTDPKYHDRWDGDILYYTGAGLRGNQELTLFNNNLKLAESSQKGIDVYLFEQFKEKQLIYRGRVKLCDKVGQEQQKDIDGNLRNTYIFPLQIIPEDRASSRLMIDKITAYQKEMSEQARKLTDKKLVDKIEKKNTNKSSKRFVNSEVYDRDPNVAEYVKRRAGGYCDLCGEKAPFNNLEGEPYLESHHLIWLSNDGEDSIDNAVALCPNCHKKMHIVRELNDEKKLKNRLLVYKEMFLKYQKEKWND